jgi:uncharacterized protein (TIGR02284 family)
MEPEETPESEALDLQQVLTRYVDSQQGYLQVAALMDRPALAAAFAQIAERRKEIGQRVASLMWREGEEPDIEGSAEGALHRWWIRLREKLSDEEFKAVLTECVRGEKSLAAALQKALEAGDLQPGQAVILQEALAEVNQAIEHFETAVGG